MIYLFVVLHAHAVTGRGTVCIWTCNNYIYIIGNVNDQTYFIVIITVIIITVIIITVIIITVIIIMMLQLRR